MSGTPGIVIKDGRLKETDGNIINLKKNERVSIHWDDICFKGFLSAHVWVVRDPKTAGWFAKNKVK